MAAPPPNLARVSWFDAVGWAGSALLVWSLLQTRILRLRAINLVGSLVLVAYNLGIGVWPMVGLNTVLTVINVWYLVRLLATRHDERTYQVVELDPGDGVLDYVLRSHAADIARFNPRFQWDGGDPGRSAFLIVRGDDIVGVILIRPAGDGVAQVELDYVTQRFRDFTPGEFVYRRSPLFTSRGFRTVVTPAGMVAPYYERLGFRRYGDSYALDLAPGPAAG
jgi:hypothetical protein